MKTETEGHAECRNCKKVLIGTPYHKGGDAYDPITKERCKINYYGGYVCCERCDKQASLDQESSFPGAGIAKSLSCYSQSNFNKNWR